MKLDAFLRRRSISARTGQAAAGRLASSVHLLAHPSRWRGAGAERRPAPSDERVEAKATTRAAPARA